VPGSEGQATAIFKVVPVRRKGLVMPVHYLDIETRADSSMRLPYYASNKISSVVTIWSFTGIGLRFPFNYKLTFW
jgi:hypothetical protein